MLVIINGFAEKQTRVHVSVGEPQYGKNTVVRAALQRRDGAQPRFLA
jgi:hypothetical protein